MWALVSLLLWPALLSSAKCASGDHKARPLALNDEQLLLQLAPVPRNSNRKWVALHDQYAAEMEGYKEEGMDLIVYGDSIVETLRGTSFGKYRARYKANTDAWHALIASKYRAAPFGISGDRAVNVLWRLQNGEGPWGLDTRCVAVLIGTNDLGRNFLKYDGNVNVAARAVFLGVRLVLEEMAVQAPKAKVVVISLPPLQPRGYKGSYQSLVDNVNQQLAAYVAERPTLMSYVDCGSRFYTSSSPRSANQTMMPDGIHPAGPGGWILAECVEEAVTQALSEESAELEF